MAHNAAVDSAALELTEEAILAVHERQWMVERGVELEIEVRPLNRPVSKERYLVFEGEAELEEVPFPYG